MNIPDREKVTNYINSYALRGIAPKAPLEERLRGWAQNKGNLYELLGGNFIVSRKISYKRPQKELEDVLKATPAVINFTEQFFEKVMPHYADIPEQRRCLIDLIRTASLAANEYAGETCRIPLPFGKSLTVQKGCKPSRILGKIASVYNVDGYEEFRIEQSKLFNNNIINDELFLSIHPLDFMTMSDNNSGWRSCVSWQNKKASFRMGAISMLNSPCVLVAYLRGKKDCVFENGLRWNNKTWRNLVIVNENIISCVKGYPYQSAGLDAEILKFIQDLSEINYGKIIEVEPDADHEVCAQGHNIEFCTYGIMYNDFGNNSKGIAHCTHMAIAKNAPENFKIIYGGNATCMCCGQPLTMDDPTDKLLCNDCRNIFYCAECGEEYDSKELGGIIENEHVCQYCIEDCPINVITDEPILSRNTALLAVEDSFGDIYERSIHYETNINKYFIKPQVDKLFPKQAYYTRFDNIKEEYRELFL